VTLGRDGMSFRMEDPAKGLQSKVQLSSEARSADTCPRACSTHSTGLRASLSHAALLIATQLTLAVSLQLFLFTFLSRLLCLCFSSSNLSASRHSRSSLLYT
jgi:hypothetical protein